MTLSNALLVAVGAALGGSLRYSVDVWLTHHFPSVPVGTITVNSVGSFLIGVLFVAAPSQAWVLLLGVGFCGSFTTLSTLSFQLYRAWRTQGWHSFALLLSVQCIVAAAAVALPYYWSLL